MNSIFVKISNRRFSALILTVLAIVGLLALSKTPSTTALTNDTVVVSVNISALSEITVTPEMLEWLNIVPGHEASIKSLDIKNTGSTNFTKLWVNVNSFATETTNPIGKGNSLLYAAGSFVVLSNETAEDAF
ncbi:MAG: hypothetical protein NC926_08765, partial [Candidatus Omnitrophica bacterium]|nr:hypothetical protein [Candidatus Omnitrophota bacterium]